MNTISANIVANSSVLQKYGIQVKSANGDLKSTYDVLTELKPVWDSLTDVERQALGQTLAGKNQYRVLASVMQNFEHAVEATTTALNSQGSAMEENAAYMESLGAKTQLIQKDFQDLANHVIDSQLVKSILSLTHELLQLADTGLGRVLIQLTLLGGIGWGAGHLIHASNILKVFKSDLVGFGKLLIILTGQQDLLAVATGASAAASEADAAAKVKEAAAAKEASIALGQALIVLGFFVGTAAAIYGLIKLFDHLNVTFEEQKSKLEDINAQYNELTASGSELEQLKNKVGSLTEAEENRLAVLLQQEASLKRQAAQQAKLTYESYTQEHTEDRYVSEGDRAYWVTVDLSAEAADKAKTAFDNLSKEYEKGNMSADVFKQGLYEQISALENDAEYLKTVQSSGQQLTEGQLALIAVYDLLTNSLTETTKATGDFNIEVTDQEQSVQSLVEQLNELKDALSATQSAYDDFNDDGKLSYSTIASLVEKFSELDEDVLDSYIDRLTDANLTSDELNGILSDMTIALVEQRIKTMGLTQEDQRLVEMMLEEAGVANAAEIAAYLLRDAQVAVTDATDDTTTATDNATGAINNFNNTPVDVSNKTGQVDNLTFAFGRLQQKIADAHREFDAFMVTGGPWSRREGYGYNDYLNAQDTAPVVKFTERSGGGGGSSRSTTEKELTYLEQKEQDLKIIEDSYSNILSLIESEYNLLVDQGAPVEDIIAKAQEYQDQLHKENEELREFLAGIEDNEETHALILELQAKINQNSSKWWDWADKIAKKYEDIAEEAQKAAEATAETMDKLREAWDKDVEEQKEALEALQKQMEDYYQDQIDDIDAQIDALKATNKALEDQITYEEKLDAIAQARQKKAMVYKDGRWQYIEDVDAVSAAVKDFEDYQREKAFNDQIANLEKEKDALELVKKAWSDMTKSVENDKDRWLIAQKLGIDTSTAMWQQYINDMERFVAQYRDLTFAINPYGTQQLLGAGGQTLGYTTQTTAGGTVNYTSKNAIDFIEGRSGQNEMTGSDGSKWVRLSDGRTLITGADGVTAIIDPNNIGNIITAGVSATGSSGGSSSSSSTSTSKPITSSSSKPITNIDIVKSVTSKYKHANGTLSALGGLSLVGEHGAELRVLNSGDGILPADITRNLMAWGQTSPLTYIGNKLGQAMNVTIQALNLPNVVDGQGFVDYVRNNMFGQVLSYVH